MLNLLVPMLNLLFPRMCAGCEKTLFEGEQVLCVGCIHQIPVVHSSDLNNEVLRNKFYGRFPLVHATALVQFQKQGLTQRLMHRLKYRGYKELSTFFGIWLGAELIKTTIYGRVQAVLPVPLHKQKLKKRGYNQVEGFGMELAKALEVPYYDQVLIKVSKTGSQVFKTRILRFEAEEVFTVQNLELIKDKHVLLVDDIITTGATLEKCALQLLKGENVKISIATIATS